MGIVKRHQSRIAEQNERIRSRDLVGLQVELADKEPAARRWAARDMAEYPASAELLISRLALENDSSVREAILLSLTKIGTPQAVQGLVSCLRTDDVELRNEAIEVMKNLPEAVAPIMTGLLVDVDSDVRIFAVNILESLRHPDVEAWLVTVISEDTHVNVCATAVDLLGEVGSERALEPLALLKSRFPDEPYITFAADLALKRIRGG